MVSLWVCLISLLSPSLLGVGFDTCVYCYLPLCRADDLTSVTRPLIPSPLELQVSWNQRHRVESDVIVTFLVSHYSFLLWFEQHIEKQAVQILVLLCLIDAFCHSRWYFSDVMADLHVRLPHHGQIGLKKRHGTTLFTVLPKNQSPLSCRRIQTVCDKVN